MGKKEKTFSTVFGSSGAAASMAFFILVMLFQSPAFAEDQILAYIDPGTGSLFIQILIGLICGALFCIKLFFSSIKSFFGRLANKIWKNKNG